MMKVLQPAQCRFTEQAETLNLSVESIGLTEGLSGFGRSGRPLPLASNLTQRGSFPLTEWHWLLVSG